MPKFTKFRALPSFFIFVIFMLPTTTANAGDDGSSILSILKFSAGVAASMALHEGAHVLAAGFTDTRMDWRLGTYNQILGYTEYSKNNSDALAVNSAGLIVQAISSEVILRSSKIDKNSDFTRGLLAYNILNTFSYVFDYYIVRSTNQRNGLSYQGDLEGIKGYSNAVTVNLFALAITAVSIFQGYRFLTNQTFAPDWLTGKKQGLAYNLQPSGGLLITYTQRF